MALASSHWDSRNRGFIPPSQLRELSQAATPAPDFTNEPLPAQRLQNQSKPPSIMASPSSFQPPSTSSNPTSHTRSSSLFSFRSRSSNTSIRSVSNLPPNKLTRSHSPLSKQLIVPQPTLPQLEISPSDLNPTVSRLEWQHSQRSQSISSILRRSPSASESPPLNQGPPLNPEIRSVVALTVSHKQKIYYSGPLIRKLERQSDGQAPANDAGWRDVWVQLHGSTLSIWDMKEVKDASEQGKEVPPSYVNITEAFVKVLGSILQPATANAPAQKYTNIITLNTAGSNLILFCCPTTADLISWAAALRLSNWEKSRLEEIYTAHLIRVTLNDGRNAPSPLSQGQMEGWVRIRVAGQTDWKRLWMVVSGAASPSHDLVSVSSRDGKSSIKQAASRKKRISNIFSRDRQSPERPMKSTITLFASSKPKDKKTPLLSFDTVTQAFAVYPERPKLINSSTLIKLEGTYGQQELAGLMKLKQGWMLFMPDLEGAKNPSGEMLKWLIGIHDAFELYGRPKMYSWDPRDSVSMMFAYPFGPNKDLLFLDREFAETLDPREARTPVVRANFVNIIVQRMRGVSIHINPPHSPPPSFPSFTGPEGSRLEQQAQTHVQNGQGSVPQHTPRLTLVSNDEELKSSAQTKQILTPITERNGRDESGSGDHGVSPRSAQPSRATAESTTEQRPVLDVQIPISDSDAQKSAESARMGAGSRPDSKLEHAFTNQRSGDGGSVRSFDPAVTAQAGFPETERPASSPQSGQGSGVGSLSNSQLGISPMQVQNTPQRENERSPIPLPESPILPVYRDTIQLKSPGMESLLPNPYTSQPNKSTLTAFSPSSTMSLPSPHSIEVISHSPTLPSSPPPPSQQPAQLSRFELVHPPTDDDIMNEAGALYYMQELHEPTIPSRSSPIPDSTSDESESSPSTNQPYSRQRPLRPHKKVNSSSGTSPMESAGSGSPRETRGRVNLPAGDKSRPPSYSAASTQTMVDVQGSRNNDGQSFEDANADVLAALTFLEIQGTSKPSEELPPPVHISPPPVEDTEKASEISVAGNAQFRSSFAPSRKATERMAKSQAQQAAHQAAASRPGRSSAVPKVRARGTWNESSEEEEEEDGDDDEDEDDDVDSDGEPTIPQQSIAHDRSSLGHHGLSSGNGRSLSPYGSPGDIPQRPPRHLAQSSPGQTGPGHGSQESYYQGSPSRRPVSNQHSDAGRSLYHDESPHRASPQPQIRPQSEFPTPGAAHHTVWSQVLEPGRAPPERETFVQIEPPSQTMTKAFAPHGLLSAGLQDKEGRSAKRQEELAKETGASLVNVPHKPPPPQTGLLGAVSAHERERKREGGIGAALTERERERRLAEERQRKLDEFQRQQLEMAQTGSMYGGPGPQFAGYNPMMANPMMMGMNPMMGGGWGFPSMNPMMGGFGGTPQQMFAAQQAAAQAYQQTMMAYSQAGSQAGDMRPMSGMQPLNPMMTGGSMFDPRMTMMTMPMMGMNGMNGIGQLGVMPPQSGMQMNGMTGFDPRFTMQFDNGAQQGMNGSPAGFSPVLQGSPAGLRPTDVPDQTPRSSANASPRPQTQS